MRRSRIRLSITSLFLLLIFPALTFSAAAPARTPVPVNGVISGPGGSPLKGARVHLVPAVSDVEASRLALEGKTNPEPVASVSTGADGSFRLEAPEAGMWKVVAEAAGMVPQELQLIPLLEETELPALELKRDEKLEVRVKGADGKPLPGARVTVFNRSHPPTVDFRQGWEPPIRRALTDAQGVAVLPRAAREPLLVQAGGAGAFAVQADVRSGSVALVLPAGATRQIRVLDATGKKTVPGVYVLMGEHQWAVGRTSEDGTFAVPLAGGKKAEVTLVAEDGRRMEASIGLTGKDTTGKAETGPRILNLPARETFSGRVLSAADNRPVAGALVWGVDPGRFRRTGVDGSYTIDTAPGPQAWVEAAASGFFPTAGQAGGPAGQKRGPVLVLEPSLAASGVVVDEQGKPVGGVEVHLSPKMGGTDSVAAMRSGGLTRSASSGRFWMARLAPKIGYDVRLSKTGFAPATAEIAPLEAGRRPAELRVVLRKGRMGFGRVVSQDEQPVAGAEVSLRLSAGGRGPREMMGHPFAPAPLAYGAATDAQGRFEIRDLPAGTYELTAQGRGYAKLSVPGLNVPPGGGSTDLGTVILPPGVTIEGIVVDPAGQPVQGAGIQINEAGGPLAMGRRESTPVATTGSDGVFRIEDRRQGETVHLFASRDGFAPAEKVGIQVPVPSPVRIVLQPAAAVEGKTVGPDGRAVAGAMVFIMPSNPLSSGGFHMYANRPMRSVSAEDGSFRIENVLPGALDLRASAQGRQEARVGNLEVRPGQELRGVEVVLAPGAVIEGRVLSASGQPATGAFVRLAEGDSFLGTQTDGSGSYRLDGVPPGHQRVVALHKDRRAQGEIEVRMGDNTLDLTLGGGGAEVSGRVVDPDSAPVANARVSLLGRTWRHPEAVSGPDGSFTLSDVEDGTYRLFAEKEGFARSPEGLEVTVAGSAVGGLEVRLDTGGAIVGKLLGLEFAELSKVQIWADQAAHSGLVAPDGSYRIDHLEPGERRVVASLPGGERQAEGKVVLEPGASEARLDLEFGRGHTLTGRVLRNGEPAGGAAVLLGGESASSRWGETDHEGRFRFAGVAPGLYEIRVMSRREKWSHREEFELSADRDLLIELRTASVSGRVVDAADRRPIAGAKVVLTSPETGPGGLPPMEVTTDSRGMFTLRETSEGSWTVKASRSGYAPAETVVQVAEGMPVDGVELSLQATEGVTLDVLLASGRPPGDLRVTVLDPGGRALSTDLASVGEEGRVRVSTVPPGSWELLLDAGGAALISVQVTAPGHAGRVVLPPPGTLIVEVPALAGDSSGARVQLADAGGKLFRIPFGGPVASDFNLRGGTRTFDRLAPGVWKVTVTTADGRTLTGSASVTPGGTARVTPD